MPRRGVAWSGGAVAEGSASDAASSLPAAAAVAPAPARRRLAAHDGLFGPFAFKSRGQREDTRTDVALVHDLDPSR